MNELFSEKAFFELLSRLDALTREADKISSAANRVNAELVSIQQVLYQWLNPSAKERNETHT